jgi:hypothetical protein
LISQILARNEDGEAVELDHVTLPVPHAASIVSDQDDDGDDADSESDLEDLVMENITNEHPGDDLQIALEAAHSAFEEAFLISEPPRHVAAQHPTLSMESSDESSDDSSSDSGSANDIKEQDKPVVEHVDSDAEGDEPPRTRNELSHLPRVEPPSVVAIPDQHPLLAVGAIVGIIDELVVVQSDVLEDHTALDVGTILAFDDRHVLGEVEVLHDDPF